ncbi:hypothetical protein [Mucilaginibacter ginsenosidivorans]|uniref:DUF2116 family Zn-ribbon domain-containing protein n=1 Tax=Mucilaginibacter ginsenosidivorans TaxID=398053 RepID=A0A5B8UVX3_9SPHI|nr:hypothetical protein [Mucilaginibacter ginsenosidivorans]QEC62586.1 hypothetical protein FRZ54_08280 [Mucilaginibacter ginsenosidivorans]
MGEQLPKNPENTCAECGMPLGPGRRDRKFCNDLCRTAYNNRKPKKKPAAEPAYLENETRDTRRIYQVLLKNRTILYYHNRYFGDELPLRDLIGRGFNLKFFTSEIMTPDGDIERYCFDMGYHISKSETVYIVERPEETF